MIFREKGEERKALHFHLAYLLLGSSLTHSTKESDQWENQIMTMSRAKHTVTEQNIVKTTIPYQNVGKKYNQ